MRRVDVWQSEFEQEGKLSLREDRCLRVSEDGLQASPITRLCPLARQCAPDVVDVEEIEALGTRNTLEFERRESHFTLLPSFGTPSLGSMWMINCLFWIRRYVVSQIGGARFSVTVSDQRVRQRIGRYCRR